MFCRVNLLRIYVLVFLLTALGAFAESLQTINKSDSELKVDITLRKKNELIVVGDTMSQTVAPGATETSQATTSKYIHGITVYNRVDSSSGWKKLYQWVASVDLISKTERKYYLKVNGESHVTLQCQSNGNLHTITGSVVTR